MNIPPYTGPLPGKRRILLVSRCTIEKRGVKEKGFHEI